MITGAGLISRYLGRREPRAHAVGCACGVRIASALVLVLACSTDAAKPGTKETARWVNQLAASDHGELLRVAGTIAEPIERIADVVMFQVVHSGVQLHVVHRGVLPVRFKVGSESSVVGRWLTGDEARRGLSDHGFGSAVAGDVFIASDVLAYGPQF